MMRRFAILEASDRLTPRQRSRTITPQDIFLAAILFGYPLTTQLQRDYYAGCKAWDSFSMILQSEALLPTDEDAEEFKRWAFGRLEVV